MKEYSKEESIEMVRRINKLQRYIFKFKKENEREPTEIEICNYLNESPERINEVNDFLKELEEQDKDFEIEHKKHTKEDIEKARKIRKNNRIIQEIKKDLKI